MGPIITKNRVDDLKILLRHRKDEAIFISNPENVRYLTGFTGSNGVLLVFTHQDLPSIFITDSRYEEQSAIELSQSNTGDIKVLVSRPNGSKLLELVSSEALRHDIGTLLIESSALRVSTLEELRTYLATHIETKSSIGVVERLRRIKDDTEIQAIQRACEIADQALIQVKGLLRENTSERDFAVELEYKMMKLGADERSFATIVASGPRSALPHGHPTDRAIAEGDVVVVDFGATYNGYHSDCTRTFSIGEPTPQIQEVFDVVHRAQLEAISHIREGSSCKSLDEVARAVLRKSDLEHRFTHGLGHGVGLEIHEEPFLSARSDTLLDPGCVITVEPGVYLPEHFGVRIEDTLVVTKDGSRPLTKIDEDWIIT